MGKILRPCSVNDCFKATAEKVNECTGEHYIYYWLFYCSSAFRILINHCPYFIKCIFCSIFLENIKSNKPEKHPGMKKKNLLETPSYVLFCCFLKNFVLLPAPLKQLLQKFIMIPLLLSVIVLILLEFSACQHNGPILKRLTFLGFHDERVPSMSLLYITPSISTL